MKNSVDATTICERLYKLRDAVAADDLHYALYLSRDVYEKIQTMINSKEGVKCVLNCEIKHEG